MRWQASSGKSDCDCNSTFLLSDRNDPQRAVPHSEGPARADSTPEQQTRSIRHCGLELNSETLVTCPSISVLAPMLQNEAAKQGPELNLHCSWLISMFWRDFIRNRMCWVSGRVGEVVHFLFLYACCSILTEQVKLLYLNLLTLCCILKDPYLMKSCFYMHCILQLTMNNKVFV